MGGIVLAATCQVQVVEAWSLAAEWWKCGCGCGSGSGRRTALDGGCGDGGGTLQRWLAGWLAERSDRPSVVVGLGLFLFGRGVAELVAVARRRLGKMPCFKDGPALRER